MCLCSIFYLQPCVCLGTWVGNSQLSSKDVYVYMAEQSMTECQFETNASEEHEQICLHGALTILCNLHTCSAAFTGHCLRSAAAYRTFAALLEPPVSVRKLHACTFNGL